MFLVRELPPAVGITWMGANVQDVCRTLRTFSGRPSSGAEGGPGKSTLVESLAQRTGAARLHRDDFYRDELRRLLPQVDRVCRTFVLPFASYGSPGRAGAHDCPQQQTPNRRGAMLQVRM